jgi:hypothetical protein
METKKSCERKGTPPKLSEKYLRNIMSFIFSEFTFIIYLNIKKIRNKKSYSQFLRCNVIILL